ncbi:MAG: hypothetical protein SCARUB_01315 [Candidatus Scalindua rubra]|uniref:Uncharacterized protein n=1 Tax=Candidatus Scalindua rubra TaxID=1872076 RepID=A0A1E3XD67_9BACT|nr:MAG: hypothetical protein SCARUB_01315 [Candidatus Scalindua rubra]
MNEQERRERWKKDTDELYCSIGEFVVKFEHVCHALQTDIVSLLDRAGLHNQSITQILLAGITAEPLRTLFESLVCETQTLNNIERKILKNALNRFQSLTQERNDIVHSIWFIGWGNESSADFSEASGMKFHKNKSGAALKTFNQKAKDFDKLSQEAESLAKIFLRLHGCFVGGLAVGRNFVLSDEAKFQCRRVLNQMINLHEQLTQTKLPQNKIVLKRQIEATDRQIDDLVYELYGLNEEEIKIVESGS